MRLSFSSCDFDAPAPLADGGGAVEDVAEAALFVTVAAAAAVATAAAAALRDDSKAAADAPTGRVVALVVVAVPGASGIRA